MYLHAASNVRFAVYRGYDAQLGRWLNRDPLGLYAGTNVFAYAENAPVIAVDPLGLWTKAQCDAARELLRREAPAWNTKGSKMSSITFGDGLIQPFNSSHSDVTNVPSVYGPVQIDWFTDITARSPVPGLAPDPSHT